MDRYKLIDHCKNAPDGVTSCLDCPNRSIIHGREGVIQALKRKGLVNHSAKLRNIVNASALVLWKDLCKVKEVPFSLSNKVTTTEAGEDALLNGLKGKELTTALGSFLTREELNTLLPVIEDIDYVYDLAGISDKTKDMGPIVYGSAIHASGTLLDTNDISLAMDVMKDGDAHISGHYAEEYEYIKYDLLSLSTLNPIQEIIGMDIDWNAASNDKSIMKWIFENDLDFIFQFGSSVVSNMIKGIGVDDINTVNLATISSINRPGCLSINMNKTWVDLVNGELPYQDEITEEINSLISSGELKM